MIEFQYITCSSIRSLQKEINKFLDKNPDWKRDGPVQTTNGQDGNYISCDFIQIFSKESDYEHL